jgi:hypothetical protein
MSFLYDQEIKKKLVVCDCNHLFVIFMRLHKVSIDAAKYRKHGKARNNNEWKNIGYFVFFN